MPSSSPDLIIDFEVIEPKWQHVIDASQDDMRAAIACVLDHVVNNKVPFEVSLAFTNDHGIQALNKTYRQKDKATNVLSFPQVEKFSDLDGVTTPVPLGDIVLSWDTICQEAEEQDKVLMHHVIHLIVHGVMHLLGFDHMTDIEADEMENIEIEILRQLHIPNPYL